MNLNGSSSGTTKSAGKRTSRSPEPSRSASKATLSVPPDRQQQRLDLRHRNDRRPTRDVHGSARRGSRERPGGRIFRYELQANKQLLNKQTTTNGRKRPRWRSASTAPSDYPELTLSTEPQKLGKARQSPSLFALRWATGALSSRARSIVRQRRPPSSTSSDFCSRRTFPQGSKALTDRLTASWGGSYRQLVYPSDQGGSLHAQHESSRFRCKLGSAEHGQPELRLSSALWRASHRLSAGPDGLQQQPELQSLSRRR